MSLHHNSIIHGSRSNRSDTKRIGFIVRFVTPHYDLGPQRTPFLRAKGTFAGCEHLKIAEGPAESDIRTGVLVEYAPTAQLFGDPHDDRTKAYVTGRMG